MTLSEELHRSRCLERPLSSNLHRVDIMRRFLVLVVGDGVVQQREGLQSMSPRSAEDPISMRHGFVLCSDACSLMVTFLLMLPKNALGGGSLGWTWSSSLKWRWLRHRVRQRSVPERWFPLAVCVRNARHTHERAVSTHTLALSLLWLPGMWLVGHTTGSHGHCIYPLVLAHSFRVVHNTHTAAALCCCSLLLLLSALNSCCWSSLLLLLLASQTDRGPRLSLTPFSQTFQNLAFFFAAKKSIQFQMLGHPKMHIGDL